MKKTKAKEFLEVHSSGKPSTFVDDAKWRQENSAWLKKSQRVTYAIMDYMQDNHLTQKDLAEKLDVSQQFVSKILSGKMNFTLKTISLIEERIGLELFRILVNYNYRKII